MIKTFRGTLPETDGTSQATINNTVERIYLSDPTTNIGYSYPGVDRSKMNQVTGGVFDFSGYRGSEPYILDDIQTSSQLSGKKGGPYGIELANFQSGQDIVRMTKFLSSPAGLLFIARQNALAISPRVVRQEFSNQF